MTDKPNLTLINTVPRDALPMESLSDFKQWVLEEKLKPSMALRKLMEKYQCPDIHVTAVMELLQLTYPRIDIDRGGFRFKFMDANYPHCPASLFSDDDFDDGLGYLVSHPTEPGPNAIETVLRSFKDFEKWLLDDKDKPSVALRRYMKKYHPLHTTNVIEFLVAVYSRSDFYGSDLEFRILESGYPNSDPRQFSDEDFDKGIAELLSLPPEKW